MYCTLKVEYGEACWVALCVHDDKIPILEWYHGEDSVKQHQPFKVLDLLFANYVSPVVADSRSFIIGLRDLEPIELAALHPSVDPASQTIFLTHTFLLSGSQLHPPQGVKPPLPPRSSVQFPSRLHTVDKDNEAGIEDVSCV
ncbi:hypothetical protein NECAME_02445 [Necator americanus]|uniref:Uncharacterized protein n=1 Tax=Necator americanus TaxID=51031 RepID=W2TET1_NECAM|nr:hypothetical protein NECAME_02445 [Necator americanus]ETN80313.1 hypothetical protein NECAME_02445 [Necator americanus]